MGSLAQQNSGLTTLTSTNIHNILQTRWVLSLLTSLGRMLSYEKRPFCCYIGNIAMQKVSVLMSQPICIFDCYKILKLQDLITHKTMFMLYKANNRCLEGRLQAFVEPTSAILKHDTRKCKLLCVKKSNTTHRLLSITVRGLHTWNGLASEITQLPSLQQFKKRLKSMLLSSYL